MCVVCRAVFKMQKWCLSCKMSQSSRQVGYNVRNFTIATVTKWCRDTEKEPPGPASERRETLTEQVKFEFSDGLIAFKVEEIASTKVHRIKVYENAGEWQDYTVCVRGVVVVEGWSCKEHCVMLKIYPHFLNLCYMYTYIYIYVYMYEFP